MKTPAVSPSWISLAGTDGEFDAYLALPPAGSGPGLLLYQEIFGVNEHIRAVAGQYALDGFVVLAPDVFWRQQRRVELGYAGKDMQRARALAAGVKRDALMHDLAESVKALRARPEVGSRRIGAIGYCMGGRLAFNAAALTDIDAAVAYYGGGIQDQLALAERIRCPMMFHYGALDAHIPATAVDAVRHAMHSKQATVHVYDGAEHGFNCWSRASYHAGAAALAHGRSLAFLAEHLF